MSNLLIIIFGIVIGWLIGNCINSIKMSKLINKIEEKEKEELNPTTIYGNYDTSISLYNIKKAKTRDDKDAIIIQHAFTNPNSTPKKFYLNYEMKLFQDNVELTYAITLPEEADYDCHTEHLCVKNGATVIVEHAYVLRNHSNIEMEIDAFNGNRYTYTIDFEKIK